MTPYYDEGGITIYHGDFREVLPGLEADVVVADPPYGETSLAWDRWPDGWPQFVAERVPAALQLWCFGSTRMFLTRRDEFAAWRLAQDIVWTKPRGRGTTTDRFNRSHELLLHWYRGPWGHLHRDVPRIPGTPPRGRATRRGAINDGTKVKPIAGAGTYYYDGTRRQLSVIPGDPGDPRTTLHPNQKPVELLSPIITYSCPEGGTVLDPFMGSGSTLRAAKDLGRKAIGVEIEERYCEIAVRRCAQEVLPFGVGD